VSLPTADAKETNHWQVGVEKEIYPGHLEHSAAFHKNQGAYSLQKNQVKQSCSHENLVFDWHMQGGVESFHFYLALCNFMGRLEEKN
jgi:hypothetical protein